MHPLHIAGYQPRIFHGKEKCRGAVRHLREIVEGTAEHGALPVGFDLHFEIVEDPPKVRVGFFIGKCVIAPDCGDLHIFFESGGFIKGDVQIV